MAANRARWGVLALALVCLSATACSKKAETNEPAADADQPLAQGERALKRETWESEPFKLEDDAEVQVSAELKDGPAVDVYVLSEAGLNQWNTMVSSGQQNSLKPEYFPALGLEGLSASFTSPWTGLKAGNYFIVIDNTSYGGTAPPSSRSNDIATVDFKVESRASGE